MKEEESSLLGGETLKLKQKTGSQMGKERAKENDITGWNELRKCYGKEKA